jgi:hypothetical protein
MTIAEARVFFDGYADAFTRFDVDRICGHWAFPAYFAARGKRIALDESALRDSIKSLCDFYRGQGVARAAKSVAAFEALTATIGAVLTDDILRDASGAQIAAWRHGYLVSKTDAGPRIVAAFPDAELDAWERRGAKLGSW